MSLVHGNSPRTEKLSITITVHIFSSNSFVVEAGQNGEELQLGISWTDCNFLFPYSFTPTSLLHYHKRRRSWINSFLVISFPPNIRWLIWTLQKHYTVQSCNWDWQEAEMHLPRSSCHREHLSSFHKPRISTHTKCMMISGIEQS